MREKKWTQGPWKAEEEYSDGGCVFIALHNDKYDEVIGQSGYIQPANAALISAAPELLEALEGLIKSNSVEHHDSDNYLKYLCVAKSALAKAYGEDNG